MVLDKTLYNRLEIEPTDDTNIIKKAYFKLSRKWHPDKNPNNIKEATKKFQEISEAYDILKDNDKREKYNRYGMDMINDNGRKANAEEIFKHFFSSQGMNPFSNMGFSFSQSQRKKKKEEDIVVPLNVSLEDIYNEKKINFKYTIKKWCSDCNMTGSKNKKCSVCNICNGTGMEKKIIQRGPMIQQIVRPCSKCKGTGKYIMKENICSTCNGNGMIMEEKNLNFSLKQKSIYNDKQIILREKGHHYINKKTHLIMVVRIKDHPKYKIVNNNNLLMDMEISLLDSIAGFNKDFIFLDNLKYNLSHNKGKSIGDGDIMIVNGLGLYNKYKNKGDLLVRFHVKNINIETLTNNEKILLGKILKQNYSKSLSTKKLNLEEFNQHKYEQQEHRQQQRAHECTHQ